MKPLVMERAWNTHWHTFVFAFGLLTVGVKFEASLCHVLRVIDGFQHRQLDK